MHKWCDNRLNLLHYQWHPSSPNREMRQEVLHLYNCMILPSLIYQEH
jgi:hypothetical protein